MSEIIPHPHDEECTVVTWNILLDYTRTKAGLITPQKNRLESYVSTLGSLGVDLDVVCLQEAQGRHGEQIARNLGHEPGDWYNHNTSKRPNEYIGMFGEKVGQTEYIDLPHDKRAIMARIGRLAVVGIHNRREIWGPKRRHQMEQIVQVLEGQDQAVIMGDGNDLAVERSRRVLRRAGFEPAFRLAGKYPPKTHPTAAYREIFYTPPQKLLAPHGTASDIIYVRGCEVLDVGVFEGDSDHRGLWARIKPAA